MSHSFTLFCTFVLSFSLFVCLSNSQEIPLHTLKPPFGVQHWSLGGDAHLTEGFIRLAEDRQSKKGWFWNNIPCDLTDWEVTFQYRVHGVSRVGADGMAFWYTEESKVSGDLFGNQEKFKGLGLIIDTYDNDKTGKHPYLSVLVNDGGHSFDHDHGKGGANSIEKGGCSIAARNLKQPSAIRVTYTKGILNVYFDTESSGSPRPCVQNLAVNLPKGYFFGFSAATGQLADNHDVHSFIVRNLDYANPYSGTTVQEASFSRILASLQRDLFQTTKDTTERILGGQIDLSGKLDNLNALIRSIPTSTGGGGGVQPPPVYNQPRGSDVDCRDLSSQMANILRNIERLEKDISKKFAEAKQVTPPVIRESGGFNLVGWLTFIVVLVLLGMQITAFVITKNERRKAFF